MRVAVVGTGAVGGYFGGRLAQGGAELVVIARGAQLEAIRRDGIRIESVAGDAVVRPAECGDDPARVSPVEVVLLGVKAWQVASVAHGLAPLLAPGGCVLPLQNGIEAPGQIDQALGAGHALGGLCRILSEVIGPGRIRHSGIEPYVAFGELAGRARARRAGGAAARHPPGHVAQVPPDRRVGCGRRLVGRPHRHHPRGARAPAATARGDAGDRSGGPRGGSRAGGERRAGRARPARRRAGGRNHVVAAGPRCGRPAEVDAQIGAVVRLARAAGVPTPYHAAVLRGLEASSASWPGADWRGPAREQ
jgi:2-dehydropantoate 2-reductase